MTWIDTRPRPEAPRWLLPLAFVLASYLQVVQCGAGCSVDDPCPAPEDQEVTASTTSPSPTTAILVATLTLPLGGCPGDPGDSSSSTTSTSTSDSSTSSTSGTAAEWGEDCLLPIPDPPGGCPGGCVDESVPCAEGLYCLAETWLGMCLSTCDTVADCAQIAAPWSCVDGLCEIPCESDINCLDSLGLGKCSNGKCVPG